ncbi:MAG: sulfotransferase domain-containing protein [Actinomycetota bacterium]
MAVSAPGGGDWNPGPRAPPELEAPVSVLSPWLDQQVESIDAVVAALDAQEGRRVIKTHTPLDGLPREPGVTYVCVGRDPHDMAGSMVDHQANIDMERVLALRERAVGNDDLADFGPTPGPPPDPEVRLREWVRENPPYSLSSLQRCLHHWHTFWVAADDPAIGMWHDDTAFFRAARRSGAFAPDLEADYEAIVAAQVPPALAAWVHGGRGAVAT